MWGPCGGADLGPEGEPPGDVDVHVTLDAAQQSGKADASIRIHASRETIFALITNCQDALKLVPGLEGCDVLSSAADGSQIIRHRLNYSWYVPKLTYELRAVYQKPGQVSMERISGDLKKLRVSWTLTAAGDDTIAHYAIELAPGFWVPHWVVKVALRRDLPKMLLALRARAEAAP
jgi:ribosome-associated toxin RatA of RatAB toxin-antitoxin module